MKIKVTVKALTMNFAENNQRSLTSETETVIPLDKCRNYKAHCQTQPLQVWGANYARKYTLIDQHWTFVFYITEYSATKEISAGTTEFLIAYKRA